MKKKDNPSLCPICLKQREEFDKHHVIWKTDGGSDHPVNILRICRTCHAILTFGESEAWYYDKACVAHQQCCYGIEFELHSHLDRRKNETLMILINERKWRRKHQFTPLSTKNADELIRMSGQATYVVMMSVIHEVISMGDFDKAKKDKEFAYQLSKNLACYLPHPKAPKKVSVPQHGENSGMQMSLF